MAGITSNKIRVAILDDHQSILDGYQFRLRQISDIEVVGTSVTAEEFESLLADRTPDVILLDVFVPISNENPNHQFFLRVRGLFEDMPVQVCEDRARADAIDPDIIFRIPQCQTPGQCGHSTFRGAVHGDIPFADKAYMR